MEEVSKESLQPSALNRKIRTYEKLAEYPILILTPMKKDNYVLKIRTRNGRFRNKRQIP